MAVTNLGRSSISPDNLVDRIGDDITYITCSRGAEKLTLGKFKGRYYFKLLKKDAIFPLVTRAIAPNERAKELFAIFRAKGFNSRARKTYNWRSAEFQFDFEKAGKRRSLKAKKTVKKSRSATTFTSLSNRDQLRLDQMEPLSTGTCFCFGNTRYFITNYHVVEGADALVIKSDCFESTAKVVKVSYEHDLALLWINRSQHLFEPLKLSKNSPALGDVVFTAGYPDPTKQGYAVKYTEGSLSALSGLQDISNRFQISIPLQPGNSGGALAASSGDVIGVVCAVMNDLALLHKEGRVSQGVNFAVSYNILLKFLTGGRLFKKSELFSDSSDISRSAAIKNVVQATALVVAMKEPILDVPEIKAEVSPFWKKALDFFG
jgi:S1-C subfamily serine protease